MQICITSTGPTLESQLDPRFGRCPWFLFVDTDNDGIEAVENPNVDQSSGAGIQSAQLVADRHVAAVLTGECGPKAQQVLKAAGTKILTGCEGTIRDVVERFRVEETSESGSPDSEAKGSVGRPTERLDEPAATIGSVPPPMGLGLGFRHRHGQAGGGGGGGGGRGRGRGRGGRGGGR